ncbi:alcohol dehydrogenase catalytic domain-containing protein [Umezawaea endophytica]|uniref:Alcohol dehydrogenase catalytic domain-containing protein n=1 Tax=Umezawaea endophytica TaxID=1654476 RepID=A0A9X2VFS0_9PSEU|nr:alcohol dehydrogenase catalytic domain-containing protein [Umezawaea endophytica]MCS7475639.1 alcohol dehydrogenase catalytic domain-containing protein [Umezawaea endophytica]
MTATPVGRALTVLGPGRLDLREWPEVEPGPGDAVVDVAYGGICGSDVHYWQRGEVGESVLRDPMVLGHEVVGTVRRAADDGSGPPEGTPVAVHPAQTCGTCPHCLGGLSNLCPELRYLGSAARRPHTQGGFADRLVVPGARLVPVPDGLDLRTAALAEPASVARHALARLDALAGRSVLVTGAGPIGLLTVALARIGGAAEIVVTDLFARPLEVARQVGATLTVPAGEDLPQVDVALESAGSPAALAAALRALRPGGTLVQTGQLPATGTTAPFHLAVTRELTLTGSSRFAGGLADTLATIAAHRALFAPVVSAEHSPDDAEAALAVAADPATTSKVLLRFG